MPRRPLPCAILLALLLALPACYHSPPRRPSGAADAAHVVYVVRRSWHIDIGFPAQDLEPPLATLRDDFPGVAYLVFGFGDRRYLLSQQHSAGNMLAALWPGPGLLLLTLLRATPQQAFGSANVLPIAITMQQSRDLQRFVWQTLSKDTSPVQPLAVGPYAGSVFYAASLNYSALHTCNTWAARALHAGRLPVRSTGVEFAGQVWSQAQHLTPQP
jgi:hypothetical protein